MNIYRAYINTGKMFDNHDVVTVEDLRERDKLIMANARRLGGKIEEYANWYLYAELFGTGSMTANRRCEEMEIDPDGYSVDLY